VGCRFGVDMFQLKNIMVPELRRDVAASRCHVTIVTSGRRGGVPLASVAVLRKRIWPKLEWSVVRSGIK